MGNVIFSGSEPHVGKFSVTMETDHYYITVEHTNGVVSGGECRLSGFASAVKDETTADLSIVYRILREVGFTIAGYQTAEVIQFPQLTPLSKSV